MSALIPILIWLAERLFGFKLSNFAAGAMLAAILFTGFGYYSYRLYDAGRSSAKAECETDALRSQLAAAEADRDRARKAAADAALRMAKLQADADSDKEGTANYVAELQRRADQAEEDARKAGRPAPVDSCAITCDDLRGMRIPSAVCGTAPRASRPARLHVPGLGAIRGTQR